MNTTKMDDDLYREMVATLDTARPQDVIAALSGVSLVQVVRVLKAVRAYSAASGWDVLEKQMYLMLTGDLTTLPTVDDQMACSASLEVIEQAGNHLPYTRLDIRTTSLTHRE